MIVQWPNCMMQCTLLFVCHQCILCVVGDPLVPIWIAVATSLAHMGWEEEREFKKDNHSLLWVYPDVRECVLWSLKRIALESRCNCIAWREGEEERETKRKELVSQLPSRLFCCWSGFFVLLSSVFLLPQVPSCYTHMKWQSCRRRERGNYGPVRVVCMLRKRESLISLSGRNQGEATLSNRFKWLLFRSEAVFTSTAASRGLSGRHLHDSLSFSLCLCSSTPDSSLLFLLLFPVCFNELRSYAWTASAPSPRVPLKKLT